MFRRLTRLSAEYVSVPAWMTMRHVHALSVFSLQSSSPSPPPSRFAVLPRVRRFIEKDLARSAVFSAFATLAAVDIICRWAINGKPCEWYALAPDCVPLSVSRCVCVLQLTPPSVSVAPLPAVMMTPS